MVEQMPELQLEFAGEWVTLDATRPFVIGREGDLTVDDNQYLHRQFLEIRNQEGLWWLSNVGSRLSATISAGASHEADGLLVSTYCTLSQNEEGNHSSCTQL